VPEGAEYAKMDKCVCDQYAKHVSAEVHEYSVLLDQLNLFVF